LIVGCSAKNSSFYLFWIAAFPSVTRNDEKWGSFSNYFCNTQARDYDQKKTETRTAGGRGRSGLFEKEGLSNYREKLSLQIG